MRRWRFLFAIVLLPLLAACTLPPPALVANVQVFHRLPPGERGSIAVKAMDDRKATSLEFSSYARRLEGHLAARGFTLAAPDEFPDYEAWLDYGIDGTTVTRTEHEPLRGVVGFDRRRGRPDEPIYGTTGYRTVVHDDVVYTRTLSVDLLQNVRRGQQVKVYEGRVTSRGGCGRLPSVAEPMLRALLADFPGMDGGTRTIEVPYAGC